MGRPSPTDIRAHRGLGAGDRHLLFIHGIGIFRAPWSSLTLPGSAYCMKDDAREKLCHSPLSFLECTTVQSTIVGLYLQGKPHDDICDDIGLDPVLYADAFLSDKCGRFLSELLVLLGSHIEDSKKKGGCFGSITRRQLATGSVPYFFIILNIGSSIT